MTFLSQVQFRSSGLLKQCFRSHLIPSLDRVDCACEAGVRQHSQTQRQTQRLGVSSPRTCVRFFNNLASSRNSGPVSTAGCVTAIRSVSFWRNSTVAEWNKAVSEAEKVVGYPTSFMSLRCLLSDELSNVAMQMHKLVGTGHPLLKTARNFFNDGKHSMQTRGLLVLLMSKTAGPCDSSKQELNETMVSGIYPSQRNLAELTEMINTAVLIHKGVLNLSSLELQHTQCQSLEFGNKVALLSGDFILANVSTSLAELNNTHAVEIIASALADLSGADFTDLRDQEGVPVLPATAASLQDWQRQTYLTSASLIAKSCKAALMLAHHPEELQNKAYEFGENIAYARQLSEELHSFRGDAEEGGVFNVTSAPVILHLLSDSGQADVQKILDQQVEAKQLRKLLRKSPAIAECKDLCKDYGDKALQSLSQFSDSEAKLALQNIVRAITAV